MTINDIAKIAGVSISTVSKIINNKDEHINEKTRERVLSVIKEYNYYPYNSSRSISQIKSFVIGLVVKDMKKSFGMINGIISYCEKNGYNVIVADSKSDVDIEKKNIELICKRNVDGVIWQQVNENDNDYKKKVTKLFESIIVVGEKRGSYRVDYKAVGEKLCEKILSYKHNKIIYYTINNDIVSDNIVLGIERKFESNNLSSLRLARENDKEKICNLCINEEYSAIVCDDYNYAVELKNYFNSVHLECPEDVSILSLNDTGNANSVISSIHINLFEFGEDVAKQIVNVCENSKEKIQYENAFKLSTCFNDANTLDVPAFCKSNSVITVGSINIDLTFRVDHLPDFEGKVAVIDELEKTMGGKGANQAIGLSKLGINTSIIGCVGDDIDANLVFNTFKKFGISTKNIDRISDYETGKAYIFIDHDGRSTISILGGANQFLDERFINDNEALFYGVRYLLLSSEIPYEAVVESLKISKRNGVQTIFKPAALEKVDDEVYKLVDYFVPNKQESKILSGLTNGSVEKQAEVFLKKGVKNVIITLADEGCYFRNKEQSRFFEAEKIVPLDTTGGADAFISCFAACMVKGVSVENAIKMANCAAAICVSKVGVIKALADEKILGDYMMNKK